MDDFDRKWERLNEQLLAQARGDEPKPVVSTRTLFGIPSTVETKMERFAAEIEQERQERVAAKRDENGEGDADSPGEHWAPKRQSVQVFTNSKKSRMTPGSSETTSAAAR